jgi:hypothetical protein
MAQKLTDLRVREVSLVDSPANKGARIVFLKRADAREETNMGDVIKMEDAAVVEIRKTANDEINTRARALMQAEPKFNTIEKARVEVRRRSPTLARVETIKGEDIGFTRSNDYGADTTRRISGPPGAGIVAQIEQIARSIQLPDESFASAKVRAWNQRPDLRSAYEAERYVSLRAAGMVQGPYPGGSAA